jgi:Putative ER transporter, 6TM, N-terminal
MSTAASVAIGCAVIVLVFPESLNHQMLTGVSKLLNVLCQLVEMQEQVLSPPDAEQRDLDSKTPTQFQAMAAGAYGGIEKCTFILCVTENKIMLLNNSDGWSTDAFFGV